MSAEHKIQSSAPASAHAVDHNITWSHGQVSRAERESLLQQRGCVLWLTGLSGSGKSTLARAIEERLIGTGHLCYVLDGDNLRHGLNRDLGFSPEDRSENIRRVSEVAALFADAGTIVVTAFISPYQADRDAARARLPVDRFLEIHVDAPLEVCEARDPKGLYKKARQGKLPQFTGIDAPYDIPRHPDVRLVTAELQAAACVDQVMQEMRRRKLIDGNAELHSA